MTTQPPAQADAPPPDPGGQPIPVRDVGDEGRELLHEGVPGYTIKFGIPGIAYSVVECPIGTNYEWVLRETMMFSSQFARFFPSEQPPVPQAAPQAAPAAAPPPAQAPAAVASEQQAAGCPSHVGRALKASNYGGWYCTGKQADQSYCGFKMDAQGIVTAQ